MKRIERDIFELLGRGEELVLATILESHGSTPRSMGAQMVVRPDGEILGTIGGGRVEAEAIKAAGELREKAGAILLDYSLAGSAGADMDLICGGRLSVLIESLAATGPALASYQAMAEALDTGRRVFSVALLPETNPSGPLKRFVLGEDGSIAGDLAAATPVAVRIASAWTKNRPADIISLDGGRYFVEPVCGRGTVYIFGAGHVGLELARLASQVEFRTVVLDDRDEFATRDRFPMAEEVIVSAGFAEALQALPIRADSYLVIVTRGHSHDRTVLEQALKTKAGYIGMLGSRKKSVEIRRALAAEGFSEESLDKVHCPIGLKIGAETTAEIGVSIVAELIQARATREA